MDFYNQPPTSPPQSSNQQYSSSSSSTMPSPSSSASLGNMIGPTTTSSSHHNLHQNVKPVSYFSSQQPPPMTAPPPSSTNAPTNNFHGPPPNHNQYNQTSPTAPNIPNTQYYQQPPPPPQQIQQPQQQQQNVYTNGSSSNNTNGTHYNHPPQPPTHHHQLPTQQQEKQQQQQKQTSNNNYNGHSQPQLAQGDSQKVNNLSQQMSGMSVTNQGFNKLWGNEICDLLQARNLFPTKGKIEPPEIRFHHEYLNSVSNCSPELFRCTLTKVPETKQLLQKSRLPLGILIHPYKDLKQLPVVQCSTIVRCRSCRTYINPFVYFIDQRRWKCNLCSRVNELPEEFQYDPVSKTYGDPSRRPEVRSATIEYLAPKDYMVRPPQAPVYLYLLDVSSAAVRTGYLKTVCETLLENLDRIPGENNTQIGFITYDSRVHFYNLGAENLSQPHEMVVCDIDDIFIPCLMEDLLVNLQDDKEIVQDLLAQLPISQTHKYNDSNSALGAALQAAYQLMSPIGGRITVFQCTLPTVGPGALCNREVNVKSVKDLPTALNPSTDFYKKLALDFATHYIAVDCFFLNSQYVDIASISCVSKFSGGCFYHFPNYHISENPSQSYRFKQTFERYVVRKIGFEAVMRVRCSRGLSIHTFHGNFFMRSTDLMSLPNCNPDAGFGMQLSIDEDLKEYQTVCFQAALLYTSSKGERRIRVHTLCLPVVGNINDVLNGADQQCVIGLVAKMAVDRCLSSSLSDAREGFMSAAADPFTAYLSTQHCSNTHSLIASPNLKLLPLYTHAILKSPGFRSELNIGLDERVYFLNQMKFLPLHQLIQAIYPNLYAIHNVMNTPLLTDCDDEDDEIPDFPLLHLCSSRIDTKGVFLMDTLHEILVYVCHSVAPDICKDLFGIENFSELTKMNEFPDLDNTLSTRIRNFIQSLQVDRPQSVPVRIFRDDSRERVSFVCNLVEDRERNSDNSYHQFLLELKQLVRNY